MQAQVPQINAGTRRSSAGGARPRVCLHCGRSFRRTEHLERHVRTHTKEKPFVCFCGAAFTRRDLLKRHNRISHQDRAVSPNSHAEQDIRERPRDIQPNGTPASQYPYNVAPEPRADVPPTPAVGEWTSSRHGSYIGQTPGVLGAGDNGNLSANIAVSDPDILEAAQLLLPTTYRDTSQSLPYIPAELTPFQDFTHFLGSIGLPAEWDLIQGGSSVYNEAHHPVPEPGRNVREQQNLPSRQTERTRADSPFRSWLPSVPPGDQSLGAVSDHEPPQLAMKFSPSKVSEEQRLCVAASLEPFRHVIPGFVLPSRHTFTRYLTSYFDGFDPHLPFIHIPTFRVNERTPEVILGLLTIGAQYRFEYRNAERLFHAAKAIVLERMSKPMHTYPTPTPPVCSHSYQQSHPPKQSPSLSPPETGLEADTWYRMENIRCLLLLMGYATWEVRTDLLQEAFALQNVLVRCLREAGLTETSLVAQKHRPLQWHEWAEEESIRRTKFIAFCFVHMHSVAYNVYPVLRSSEIHLRLPCSTAEWKAVTANEWEAAQKEVGSQQLFFQEALTLLLQQPRTTTPLNPIPAPLGNYILLHGLLQRIHLVSELSLPNRDQYNSLPTEELNKLERALRSWTSVWQQAPESSLDPHNENGPIPFTSSSLLGLAYVRLSLNLGPYRRLDTRDPYCIAATLYGSPRPQRSYRLTPALIYSAHALSIPVRLGIDHVARSQAFFWSVRHSLASLECAVLLSKWLLSLGTPVNDQSLSENESRILSWTRSIVQEAYDSMDLRNGEALTNLEPNTLGFAVIKLWSRLFCRNTQWPFINVLGQSLEKYLAMIQAE